MVTILTHWPFGRIKLPAAKISQCCCVKSISIIANSVFALDPEWHDSRAPIDVHLPIPREGLWDRPPNYFRICLLFGGTLVVRFDITEPLGFVQDAWDVTVLLNEWLAVLGLCSVRMLDEPAAGRYACMSWLLGGEWNKQVYNKYIFTARLGCQRLVTRRKL